MNKSRKNVGRRRSRSLIGFASKGLCETVPKSLPPSERLLIILERCFQYSLSAVQKEFISCEDFDISCFRKDGTNCWEKLKANIEGEDLCQLAVTETTMTDHSLNVKLGDREKAVLEAESNKWSEQVQNYRNALEKEIDSPCTVNTMEWKDSGSLYDYSDIIKYVSSTHKKIQLQVNKLASMETSVNKSLQYNNHMKQTLHSKCENIFQQKHDSAKSLIMEAKYTTKKKHF